MTEERLSRRARRAQDEATHPDPAAEFAARVQAGEVPEVGPDGHVLSRRERRRLERVTQPVESWTAEEEMAATGQIPALTPEVIAEQERLARLKAQAAQAEAIAASVEMRVVAPHEALPDRVAEVTGQWAQVAADAAVEPQEAPVEALPAPEPVEPEPVVPEPVAPQPVVSEPVEPEPAHEVPLLDAAPPSPEPIPASLRHLFPPGSLQARAFEEQDAREAAARAAAEATAMPEVAAAPEVTATPEVSVAPEVTEAPRPDDPAEEIRRLAASAMEGLQRATHEDESAASAPAPEPAFAPVAERAPEPEPASEPEPAPSNPFAEALAAAEAAVAAAQPVDMGNHAYPVEPALSTEPVQAAEPAPSDEPAPLTDSSLFAGPSPFAAPELAAPASAVPTPELTAQQPVTPASPWQEHPLDAVPTIPASSIPEADLNAYTPVENLPTPDLAALEQARANPFAPVGATSAATGAFPQVTPTQSALFPGQPLTGATPIFPGALQAGTNSGVIPLVNGQVPTMPGQPLTGAIPVVKREARLQEAGGVRHFRWVHFLVLGALMFVLGVVVYQVIRYAT